MDFVIPEKFNERAVNEKYNEKYFDLMFISVAIDSTGRSQCVI